MTAEFRQLTWDDEVCEDLEQLLRLAVREDLGAAGDLTTLALVPDDARGRAAVVARRPGILAGEPAMEIVLRQFEPRLRWSADLSDGQAVAAGQTVGRIEGPVRGLLTAERPLLNLLGRLSGIASTTRQYVDAVAGTAARIYDTRKTTPGWRRLEKYAVRCGGGWNHRTGLFDAVLIKDNHLAAGREQGAAEPGRAGPGSGYAPAEAVQKARRFLAERQTSAILEVEVDSLEQLDDVLGAAPDIVLLDNFSPEQLREAVARRNASAPAVQLEASGGIDLGSIRRVAHSGVERISVGALTHSAVALDFGLDWQ
jgi:nicotinate-nucleotide pyrophosphorylase (carboxylating)